MTSVRARADTLRETSGDRVEASAIQRRESARELYSWRFMRAVDLIRTKRDGGQLDRASLEWFVAGGTDGSLPDYQAAALLIAIVLRGMTAEETAGRTPPTVPSGRPVEHAVRAPQ